MAPPKPVVLCILDGWGLSDTKTGNAVALAKTPTFDHIMQAYPSATLITYGTNVGLPTGQMGNSEVGHMNIGAGRVVEMDLRKIESAIESGKFASLDGIKDFVDGVDNANGHAHLCGVLSDGGVHSHIDHMIETAKVMEQARIKTWLHLFSDGRDVAPKSAQKYLARLKPHLSDYIQIATLSGRYYALDRDNRWERIERAYDAICDANGHHGATVEQVVSDAYAKNLTDEFILPHVIGAYPGIKDGDGLMFLNFRADRARQILLAFGDPNFSNFTRRRTVKFSRLSGFGEYSDKHNTFMDCVFPNQEIKNTLGEWVSSKGLRQFRIAETEKYPHVTFFFNGGVETPALKEDRYLAPSPKVATYDLQPEMSSSEVTENLIKAIQGGYDLIVVNFANPDMVGHTGDLDAAIEACEAVDIGLNKTLNAIMEIGGAIILCADHGNCEMMIDPETGGPHTAHTTNPVPVAVIGAPDGASLRKDGKLADLAPSLLHLMGLKLPSEMTGKSLIIT